MPISCYCKIQHDFYYVDLDGDSGSTGEIWWYGYVIYYKADGTTPDGSRLCFDLPARRPTDPMSCDNTFMVREDLVNIGNLHHTTTSKINYVFIVPSALHTYVCYFRTKPGKIVLYYQVWEDDGVDSLGRDDAAAAFTSPEDLSSPAGETVYNGPILGDSGCDVEVTGDVRYRVWTNR
jgi:hypothetical protein